MSRQATIHPILDSRRRLIMRLSTLLAAVLLPVRHLQAKQSDGESGTSSAAPDNTFMTHAFKMKALAIEAGDQAYGAVVVKDGKIVGEGPSQVVTAGDPTAHAEMQAIRDAARRLATRDLGGCVIYATSRPCRMCETAAYWAQVSHVYYGADSADGGRPTYPPC